MNSFVRAAISSLNGRRINSKLYMSWTNMRARCNCQTNKYFPRYGGRGISICAEWNDYAAFRSWALANGFAKGLTLDRADVNGNYEPSNCQWITRIENAGKDKRGSNHPNAKLTEAQAREIKNSAGTHVYIAEKYGVNRSSVSLIKSGKNWSHIQ